MSPILILGLIAIAVLGYAVSIYNFLSTAKTQIQASIQEIGNQLKRQADLIPNLQTSAKAYLKHEKDLFQMLTDARKMVDSALKSGSLDKISQAGDQIGSLLSKLQIIVESNPQIKGADVITKLMDELRDTADKVMYSRRSLIDLTADYNIKLVTFPSQLIANLFGFKKEAGLSVPTGGSFLSVSEAETAPPKISL